MSVTENRRTIAATWVGLLTALWVIGVPALVVAGVSFSFSLGSERNPGYRTGAVLFIAAAVLGVLLPLAAAVVGFRGGRPVLGAIYAVLTVLILVPAAATVLSVAQDLRGAGRSTPVDAPGPPGYCVEHSGGDTRCPGG